MTMITTAIRPQIARTPLTILIITFSRAGSDSVFGQPAACLTSSGTLLELQTSSVAKTGVARRLIALIRENRVNLIDFFMNLL